MPLLNNAPLTGSALAAAQGHFSALGTFQQIVSSALLCPAAAATNAVHRCGVCAVPVHITVVYGGRLCVPCLCSCIGGICDRTQDSHRTPRHCRPRPGGRHAPLQQVGAELATEGTAQRLC
jgi:hypothetical protein